MIRKSPIKLQLKNFTSARVIITEGKELSSLRLNIESTIHHTCIFVRTVRSFNALKSTYRSCSLFSLRCRAWKWPNLVLDSRGVCIPSRYYLWLELDRIFLNLVAQHRSGVSFENFSFAFFVQLNTYVAWIRPGRVKNTLFSFLFLLGYRAVEFDRLEKLGRKS